MQRKHDLEPKPCCKDSGKKTKYETCLGSVTVNMGCGRTRLTWPNKQCDCLEEDVSVSLDVHPVKNMF